MLHDAHATLKCSVPQPKSCQYGCLVRIVNFCNVY